MEEVDMEIFGLAVAATPAFDMQESPALERRYRRNIIRRYRLLQMAVQEIAQGDQGLGGGEHRSQQ